MSDCLVLLGRILQQLNFPGDLLGYDREPEFLYNFRLRPSCTILSQERRHIYNTDRFMYPLDALILQSG